MATRVTALRVLCTTKWGMAPRHMTIHLPKKEVDDIPYYLRDRVAARARINKGDIVILESEPIRY